MPTLTASSTPSTTADLRPSTRLAWDQKLKLLDPGANPKTTEKRLQSFQQLFAFRQSKAIVTRLGQGPRSWTALHGSLDLRHIARHLLADQIPGSEPQWVGARSFTTTRFFCIDVDIERLAVPEPPNQTKRESRANSSSTKLSFAKRCKLVEKALRMLGIDAENRDEVLIQSTPSGGRHYYVFLDKSHDIDVVRRCLDETGLPFSKGQIEFYPSTTQGLRLPFGFIPNCPHNPDKWIGFIIRYVSGRIRRFSIEDCHQTLERYRSRQKFKQELEVKQRRDLEEAKRQLASGELCPVTKEEIQWAKEIAIKTERLYTPEDALRARQSKYETAIKLIDSARRNQTSRNPVTIPQKTNKPTLVLPRRSIAAAQLHATAVRLDRDGVKSWPDAEQLLDLGITKAGSRTKVLKDLALHLIWFRNFSATQARDFLVRWALDPRHCSVDIQADLKNGTHQVADDINRMCQWFETHRQSNKARALSGSNPAGNSTVTQPELNKLRSYLLNLDDQHRPLQAKFYLSFLTYAKRHGQLAQDESGWDAAPAIKSVMRKWPGCSHMQYKARLDQAIACGAMKMTQQKWQNTNGPGRARTYRLHVPVNVADATCIDPNTALEFLSRPLVLGLPGTVDPELAITTISSSETQNNARPTGSSSEYRSLPSLVHSTRA